jgi:hypothetical protein
MIPIAQKLTRLHPREHSVTAKHPPSQAERLLAEFERGRQEGAGAAEKRANERIEKLQREFAESRATDRALWAKAEGERLANELRGAMVALEGRLQEDVARLLQPFLEAKLRAKAVAEFGAALRALVKSDGGVHIDIHGPADIVEAFANANDLNCTVNPEDTACEVSAHSDRTMIETGLRPWLTALAEANG